MSQQRRILLDGGADAFGECSLRQSDGDAAVGDVARGADELAPRRARPASCAGSASASRSSAGGVPQRPPRTTLANSEEPNAARFAAASASVASASLRALGLALERGQRILTDGRRIERNFEVRIGLLAARNRPEQHDGVVLALKVRGHGLGHVVENADDAEHRRGIDAFAAGLVVEGDVAAGDGRAERGAGFGDAVDGGGKLRHDLGLLGIAEVEAVGGGDGRCAGAGNFARGFGDGVHGAEFGIEIAPAAVAVERHGEAALVARRCLFP